MKSFQKISSNQNLKTNFLKDVSETKEVTALKVVNHLKEVKR